MIEFIALAEQCAPAIDKNVTLSIVKKESAFNPFAIGVNKGGKKTSSTTKRLWYCRCNCSKAY
jgi:hypothetical protein